MRPLAFEGGNAASGQRERREAWLAASRHAPSRNKPIAWSLLREMVSKRATIMAAINGNGPVRGSAYDDAEIKRRLPFADAERAALRVARAPMPAFDNAQRAADMFREEVEAAVLGMKPVQRALDDLVARVTPIARP